MNTLMSFPLAALTLAVSAYAYLAKRQPEYPNARVIAVFTLLGGSVGGVLLALLAIGQAFGAGVGELWLLGMALGVAMGTLPAALCGVLLAFLRAEYSGSNVALAVAVGALASAVMGLVWAHDGIAAVWTACVDCRRRFYLPLCCPRRGKPRFRLPLCEPLGQPESRRL